MHGQFVWYELTTPDVNAATKFYPRFTGWGTQKFDDDYTMWTTGGAPFAGVFRLTPELRARGVPPNWMPYVESDDIDETARLATTLGGAVINGPADIPGTGRYAVIRDPQGAVFGIYRRATGPSPAWDGTPVVGRFSWHELMTTDRKAAFAFYQQLFGWDNQGEMDMGGGAMYMLFGKGKMYGGLYDRLPDMASMPPFWLCYINVKDVSKAVDAATKAGGVVQRPRMEIPGGTIAILGDPQGAGFALHDLMVGAATPTTTATSGAKKSSVSRAKAKTKGRASRKATTRSKTKAAVKKRPVAKKAAKKAPARKAPKKAQARKAPKKSVKKAAKRRR